MSDVQVLIAGAGPTGLVIANVLGQFGIETLLVEANASTVSEPRAVSIDDESLRTMQYLGIIDEVRSHIVPGYGSYYYSAGGDCFAKVVPNIMEFGHPRRSAFRQPILEAQLREAVKRFSCVTTRFCTRVHRIRDHGESTSVELQTEDGGIETINTRYVAACDGARSGIREGLKIAMSGSTYDQRWLIVDLLGSTDRFRHTRVYCDPARPALALPGPHGTRRYEFMMLPGESAEELVEEARVRELLGRHSAEDAGLEIVRRVVYRFHARIAERWRAGNIFLAGDAAHLTPPFAGQGMNSGVRDAHNLAWKLALVLRGELGEGALDTYESERKAHAWSLIQMAVKMGHVMMPLSPLNAFFTQWGFRALSLYPPARDYVMQMKYKPKPRFDEGLVVHDVGAALCGRMFVQPMVETEEVRQVPLDDLLGPGFSIVELDRGNGAAQSLVQPAAPTSLQASMQTPTQTPMTTLASVRHIRVLGREERFVDKSPEYSSEETRRITRVRDVTGIIEQSLIGSGVRAVVLRPDRYVAAGIALDAPVNEANRVVESIVQLSHRRDGAKSEPRDVLVQAWQPGAS
ncbi:MAG: bifunctional 3-(3-hydroxy-phenyl)propionate/3-hydroxycinnamic acid hydroxylase [Burkholderiales bacterium]